MPFYLDMHLDLAMNAMEWNRDLRLDTDELREREVGLTDKPDRGQGMVNFPAMRRGNLGLCVATLIARHSQSQFPVAGWQSPEQAWAQTQGQLAWYRVMEQKGALRQICDLASLQAHLAQWQNDPQGTAIGYVMSLEGADSILSMEHLRVAYEQGLRAIGPAHYGPGIYANGTEARGGITLRGRELLREMQQLGMILDATHLCDESFWEALDLFEGAIWSSHHNSRALVPNERQASDDMYRALLARGAVIGIVMDAWMLVPGWERGVSTPGDIGLTLEAVADHIDHVCQLAGNADQVAIGSDLDGGFGRNQSPDDLGDIGDVPKLVSILASRGYTPQAIDQIFSHNVLRFLEKTWS